MLMLSLPAGLAAGDQSRRRRRGRKALVTSGSGRLVYHCRLWSSIEELESMIAVRKSGDRGQAELGWLSSRHTFSFGSYDDPQHMGLRSLRVINEDKVQLGKGFDPHPHRDMEILSYVIAGALEHRDSMGNGSVILPGEVQLMRAGTGVTHSEYNHSDSDLVHFLQIWVISDTEWLEPTYEQRKFPYSERQGRLRLVASPDAKGGSLRIRQDVSLYATVLEQDETVRHEFTGERYGWLQVVEGDVTVNGTTLSAGDGAAISGERGVELVGASPYVEALMFDVG
jgi:redox-sensitive bicupin YhaK (pirin superfamily)